MASTKYKLGSSCF